jgi:hypothetical protein
MDLLERQSPLAERAPYAQEAREGAKLGVPTRTAAASQARRLGLASPAQI